VNLREKGAFLVSSEYNAAAQKIQYVDVTSEAGETLTLAAPWEGKDIKVQKEDGTIVATTKGTAPNHDDEVTFTFDTDPGTRYYITEDNRTAPVVTADPTNAAALEGKSATFSVDAEQATSYQWQISTDGGTTGFLTAQKQGKAKITITIGKKKVVKTITVKKAAGGAAAYAW